MPAKQSDLPAPLAPGSTIGILGGGQLGRMLSSAAIELGFHTHVFCPQADSPAFDASRHTTIADYNDETALAKFAKSVDIVTYEFENVPAATAEFLYALVPVRPGQKALSVAQDRLEEKQFAASISAETAPFWQIDTEADFADIPFDGTSYVLKTRRMGYDGKGQAIVKTLAEASEALQSFNGHAAILEAFISFKSEISVILARGLGGETHAFEPGQNTHKNHILATTTIPAPINANIKTNAILIASRFAEALDYVGILGVEFFVTGDTARLGTSEGLLVNEIAPRVHNSGHWTQDGAKTSQFEQHIRAICGWPLGSADTLAPTIMTNLIGSDFDAWADIAAEPQAHLHLYGKSENRPGRKIGHVNRLHFAK